MKSWLSSLASWIVSLATSVALVGSAVRAVLLPVFPATEYRLPGFPPDPYGFSLEERLHWSGLAWAYLVNDEGIYLLGDLRFADGSAVFGARELMHMEDVKAVVSGVMAASYAALAAILALALVLHRAGHADVVRHGVSRGGWIIVGLALAIALVVLTGLVVNPDVFWGFFAGFHAVFFEGDSWLFLYSDTLIRLFPLRFWQDAFLLAAIVAVGGGLALALAFRSRRPGRNDED